MSDYYLWLDEKETGPHSASDVLFMLMNGTVREGTACRAEYGQWSTYGDLKQAVQEDARAEEAARLAPKPTPKEPDVRMRVPVPPAAGAGRIADWAAPPTPSYGDHLARVGHRFAIAAGCALFSAILAGLWGIGLLADAHSQSGPAICWLAGGLLGMAFWLYLLVQLILLRAAVERLGEKGGQDKTE
ncbi:MAG: hypothetical protein ABSF95_23500 [Verrucomicrobiota bacterium]|jgi:hypothetical protein